MKSRRVLVFVCAVALAIACKGPETLDPDQGAPRVSADSNVAELRLGESRVRTIAVPAGYSLVDINENGDLLLGNAYLRSETQEILPLPFIGTAINNLQQILGPGLTYYLHLSTETLPTPCTIVVDAGFIWDCSDPVVALALAGNGDMLFTYRQDSPGQNFSPYHYLTVWRDGAHTWETLMAIFGDGPFFSGAISENGTVAFRLENAPNPDEGQVRTQQGSTALQLAGSCPPPSPDPTELHVQAVNDAGEVVGTVVCNVGGEFEARGTRWSRTGTPSPVDGFPMDIDDYGNVAGMRTDGHAVIWLPRGTVIDLSATTDQVVSIRRFIRQGVLFGFVGTQPVTWRFGFRCPRWSGLAC